MWSRRFIAITALGLMAVIIFASSAFHKSAYEAPLTNADHPRKQPGNFMVEFREGHTYEKHIALIGTDRHVARRFGIHSYGIQQLDDGQLIAAIRADPGVLEVRCIIDEDLLE